MPPMCFDSDSHPPIPPLAGAAVDGARMSLHAADGTEFAAFAARPSAPTGAAILILPDIRGLYPFYEELALRFAEAGVEALTIDYFGRTLGSGPRGDDLDFMAHVNQTHYATLLQDMQAGIEQLAARAGVRAVFSIGFCFGGRLAFLSGTRPELGLAGAIGFYGPPTSARGDIPSPTEQAGPATSPILGLFGADDQSIPADAISQFDQRLATTDVEHELVSYPGAPHSFFDRKAADFADASIDAWRRTMEFIRAHTPSD